MPHLDQLRVPEAYHPPAAYSKSLEQCLAKPAGLRRQGESPEGWTIRQFQDHEALNQSRQGTLIKQPSPAQPTNPHRAIKSIPSKTLWNLSGENCRGVRERSESVRDEEGRGGKYHKTHLEKKTGKKTIGGMQQEANKGNWKAATQFSSLFFSPFLH